jgi:drug/metabolite transporter (DMT)-like permease
MTAWRGTAWGLGSAVSWACANMAIQSASRRLGTWSALVWAELIGGAVAAVVALLHEGPPRVPQAATALVLLGAGVASAVAYGGLFEALARGQLAVVSPIVSAWSAVSVIIVALRGEPPSALAALGIALVVGGNVTVARATSRDAASLTPRAALVAAALAATGFGVMVPLLDVAGAEVGRLWAVPFVWAMQLVVVVPWLWRGGKLRRPRNSGDVGALAASALFEAGGFIALSLGLAVAPVSVVSPMSSLSTMGSVALGVLVLRERVATSALAGAFAASLGILLINLPGG